MSKTTAPQAIVHKQILDMARDNPDASLQEIAENISGANVDLVDRVLSRYGDPKGDDTSHGDTMKGEATEEETRRNPNEKPVESEGSGSPKPNGTLTEAVTEKQLETLHVVRRHPEFTQKEIAQKLDVTPATVSTHLNGIEGFEWEDREAFCEEVFSEIESVLADTTHKELSAEIEELQQRLEVVDERLSEIASNESINQLSVELTHKVILACVTDERISEEEELRLLETIMCQE